MSSTVVQVSLKICDQFGVSKAFANAVTADNSCWRGSYDGVGIIILVSVSRMSTWMRRI